MPTMVRIRPAKGFKPQAKDKAAWEAISKAGPVEVSKVTAREAIHNSGGMYEIEPDATPAAVSPTNLQSMEQSELLQMYVSLGGKLSNKSMKRSEIITFISNALSSVEVIDDEAMVDTEVSGEGGGE